MALRSDWPKTRPYPRAGELGDHLALGDLDPADHDGKAKLGEVDLHIDLADPDLADKGMGSAVATLRRIAERQQEALVAARQRLQPGITIGWKCPR